MSQLSVADFYKWVDILRCLPALDQVIGIRLAEQANEYGVVEAVDWDLLLIATDLSMTATRRRLRPGSRLVDERYIEPHRRMAGRASLPTTYILRLDKEVV